MRTARDAAVTVLLGLIAGACDVPSRPLPLDTAALAAKAGKPSGGGSSLTAQLNGGMIAAAQALGSIRESSTSFQGTAGAYSAQANLSNTHALVSSDQAACTFEIDAAIPSAEHAAVKQQLIDLLVTATAEDRQLDVLVSKADALLGTTSTDHMITLHPAGGFLGVGRQNGNYYYGFPAVTYSDGNAVVDDAASIQDPAATRSFTFQPAPVSEGGPGTVRTLFRYEEPGSKKKSAPLAMMRCPFQVGDEITVTVAPASP